MAPGVGRYTPNHHQPSENRNVDEIDTFLHHLRSDNDVHVRYRYITGIYLEKFMTGKYDEDDDD